MKKFFYSLTGFLGFLFVTSFDICVGVMVYSYIKNMEKIKIAIILIFVIIFNALLCALCDFFRRKIMIDSPLEEILNATRKMAKGDFNIKLVPKHIYKHYDEFDLIKININKMANELSKSEILKNDFVANVSHEIKTPLSIINIYAKTLENNSISEEEKNKNIKNLQLACLRLSNLVDNILKLNKLENQKILSNIKKLNLSELLITQVLGFEELIDKKQIELKCDIEENLYINSEESYLEIIFNNLISNAVKFTNEKGIIEVKLKKILDEYIIIFKDNGCGMDEETGKHIFEKFYQGETSHSSMGNGLGLALVKRVIDVLGGKIQVDSEIQKGTAFTIIIKEIN